MSDPGEIVPFPDVKAIEAEAANWLVRLESEDVAPRDLAAFEVWRDQSAQHREVFARLAARWREFDRLEALNDYAASVDMPTPREIRSPAWTRRSVLVGSGAALAGAAVVAFNRQIFGLFQPGLVRTGIGERKTTKLDDGSLIELNTNSAIAVSYSETFRQVHLLSGEAYFDVRSNPDRPFLVYARTGLVRVVGTAFTVRLHQKNVSVIVEEGRVAVLPQPPDPAALHDKAHPGAGPGFVMLHANQDVVFDERVEHVRTLDAATLDRKLAWRNGVLSFSGEPLSEVLSDMSRYMDTEIEIDDPSLRRLPVDGYFKIGTLDTMLEALEAMAHVKVERLGPRKIRLSKSV